MSLKIEILPLSDDTNIYYESETVANLVNRANSELRHVKHV